MNSTCYPAIRAPEQRYPLFWYTLTAFALTLTALRAPRGKYQVIPREERTSQNQIKDFSKTQGQNLKNLANFFKLQYISIPIIRRPERFSIECRKTKTKVITLTNHRTRTHNARENACEQVTIGFGLTFDWMRKWREIFKPITKRSNAKTKQLRKYFWHSIENRSNRGQDYSNSTDHLIDLTEGDHLIAVWLY